MPGHMGMDQVTVENLRVMQVDLDNNFLMLRGAVPGPKNSLITIHRSRKKAFKSLDEKKAVVAVKRNPMKQSKAKATGKGK